MRLPNLWNVHCLLGALYFILELDTSSSETGTGHRRTLWDNYPHTVSPKAYSPESSAYIRRQNHLPPQFVPTTINITVHEGDMAVLPCSVSNLGTRQVAWRRLSDGQVMTVGQLTWMRDKRVIVEHKIRMDKPGVSDWNLLMKNVRQQDSGVYECQITDKKKHSMNITLLVIGPAVRKPGITITGNKYPNLGEEIRLTCNATGGPHIPEDIDWFKEGDKIDSHKYPNILITKYRSLRDQSLVSELIIDYSHVSDNGMYICRSSDEEIDSRKVTVIVADTKNRKRVPRPVDALSQSNEHGARYRTGMGPKDKQTRSSLSSSTSSAATTTPLARVSAWLALLLLTPWWQYPLCMHVI